MSALPPKADIAGRWLNVRFVPEAEVAGQKRRRRIDPSALANAAAVRTFTRFRIE